MFNLLWFFSWRGSADWFRAVAFCGTADNISCHSARRYMARHRRDRQKVFQQDLLLLVSGRDMRANMTQAGSYEHKACNIDVHSAIRCIQIRRLDKTAFEDALRMRCCWSSCSSGL